MENKHESSYNNSRGPFCFFDQKLSLLLLMITLPLLFLPKVNLLAFSGSETAGLRLDDGILLFVGFLFLCAHCYSKENLFKIEGTILLITGFSLFSYALNLCLVEADYLLIEAKIFYTVRLLEYFMFFYIGALALQFFSLRSLMQLFLGWNVCLISLQKMNLAGGITFAGYVSDVSGRVQGIASFPSEMGLILNLLFCYFAFEDPKNVRVLSFFQAPYIRVLMHKVYLYLLFAFFGVLIIFTGNRISCAALLLCFAFRLFQEVRARTVGSVFSLVILIPIVSWGIGYTALRTDGLYERSIGLFSWKNLELLSVVWDKIDISQVPSDFSVSEQGSYDMSWVIRLHKWLFMIKSYVTFPQSIIVGLGPGVAGAALDGGLLRIITEYGMVGFVLFSRLFGSLYRINEQTKWMAIAVLCNMIFFDAYLAYKTMSLFLFCCGYLFALELQRLPKLTTAPSQPENGLVTVFVDKRESFNKISSLRRG